MFIAAVAILVVGYLVIARMRNKPDAQDVERRLDALHLKAQKEKADAEKLKAKVKAYYAKHPERLQP